MGKFARLRGLIYLGHQDIARARCNLGFERGDEHFEIEVPLSDAVEFCGFVQHLEGRTGHTKLRYLCTAAFDAPLREKRAARDVLARISRRVQVTQVEAMVGRCWDSAIRDDLAVAVGDALQPRCSLPEIGKMLNHEFSVGWKAEDEASYYERWEEFVELAEKRGGRAAVHDRVASLLSAVQPTDLHRKIASLPISNFIDASFDRSLTKALRELGKRPLIHGERSMQIGEWAVADPATPHVFHVLGAPNATGFGLLTSLIAKGADGHAENILDMLRRKDLLLFDFHPWDAEYVLRLPYWVADTGKIVNCAPNDNHPDYWARRGVYVSPLSPTQFVDGLLPALGERYGELDLLIAAEKLIDIARKKPHDCFLSYSRADLSFVRDLERRFRRSDIRAWHDVQRIEVGNPIAQTIDAELAKSHCFVVVLSPDAIVSDWVRMEVERALLLFERGELSIMPVLHRDCEIPEALRAFDRADLRAESVEGTELARLTAAIRNAVARGARKLR